MKLGIDIMKKWNWNQPGIGTWKVVSDDVKGTISIYDESGKLIIEKTGLNKEAIEIIEQNFFDLVAENDRQDNKKKDNPSMYA